MTTTLTTVSDISAVIAGEVFGIGHTPTVSDKFDSDTHIVLHGIYGGIKAEVRVKKVFEMVEINVSNVGGGIKTSIVDFVILKDDVTTARLEAYMDYLMPW